MSDLGELLLKIFPLVFAGAAVYLSLRKAPLDFHFTEAGTEKLHADTLATVSHTMADLLVQISAQAAAQLDLQSKYNALELDLAHVRRDLEHCQGALQEKGILP